MSRKAILTLTSTTALGLVLIPQAALANCVTDSQGVTTCSGTITSPQTVDNPGGEEDIEVTSGSSIVVSTDDTTPLRVRGYDTRTVNNGTIRYTGDDTNLSTPTGFSAVLLEGGSVAPPTSTTPSLIDFTNNGTITATSTLNTGTSGVRARTGFGDISITNSSTGAITAGNWGILAEGLAIGADVTLGNEGTISGARVGMQGSASSADSTLSLSNSGTINATQAMVGFIGRGGIVTVSNPGTITGSGNFAYGGLVTSLGVDASVDLQNSGSITLSGDRAAGLIAVGQSADDNVTINLRNTVDGEIDVTGFQGRGLFADLRLGSGTADPTSVSATLVNEGEISVSGIATAGIRGDSQNGDLIANNAASGLIDQAAIGINLNSTGGATTATNAGTIDTGQSGIVVSNTGGDIDIVNSGDISSGSFGVFGALNGSTGDLAIDNSGTITMGLAGARGIQAGANGANNGTGNDVTLTNSGTITLQAQSSTGINASGRTGVDISVTNTADGVIDINGASGTGIAASIAAATGLQPSETVLIINEGTIQSSASGAIGILVDTQSNGVTIRNAAGGEINVSGNGMRLSSDTGGFDITNAGTITGAGNGILATSANTNHLFRLENTGTINGDVLVGGFTSVIINTGTVLGDIVTANGNDEFQISGATALIDGDISAGGGFDQILFDATDGFVFSTTMRGLEVISISGGDVTLDTAIIEASGDLSIGFDASLISSGSVTAEISNLANAGVFRLEAGSTFDMTGDFIAADGSLTQFAYDNGAGQLLADGDITFEAGSQIDIDVADQDQLMNGVTFDAAIAGGTLSDASGDISDNSALFDFTKIVLNGDTLQITIEQALKLGDAAAASGGSINSGSLANALQGLIDTGSPDAATLATALGQFPDIASLAGAIDTFQLDSSAGLQSAQLDMADDVLDLLAMRQTGLREGSGLWVMGRAGWGDLDGGDGVSGFDADRTTIAAGFDHQFDGSSTLLGVALSLGSLDGEATAAPRLFAAESDALGFALYGNGGSDRFGWHASLGYFSFDNQTTRAVPVLGETARAQFDGSAWFGEFALDFALSEREGWQFAPVARLRFVSLDLDEFEETGSIVGAAGAFENLTSVRGFAGIRASTSPRNEGGAGWSVLGELTYGHELGDVASAYSVSLPAGAPFPVFTNGRDRSSVNLDAQASYATNGGVEILIGYSGQFAGNYQDHAATFGAQIRF